MKPTEDQAKIIKVVLEASKIKKLLVVFIHGPTQTGKNEVAEFICADVHGNFEIVEERSLPVAIPEFASYDVVWVPGGRRITLVSSWNPPADPSKYDFVFELKKVINK